MKKNTSPDFVGLDALKQRHASQLRAFEDWASRGAWREFHDAHYDWWMFPIDRRSTYGMAWVVLDGDIAELKTDATFMERFRRGIELVALSWGWDVVRADFVTDPSPGQMWQDWPVRLFKMARSARLFGEENYFASLKKYARTLMDDHQVMSYGGHDLSWLFTTGIPPKGY